MPLELTSPAFKHGAFIPKNHAADVRNDSPELQWSGTPEGTQSMALILDDADADPAFRVHWLICDIPVGLHQLMEHIAPKPTQNKASFQVYRNKQGRNDFGKIGYVGPVPDRRKHHHYTFTLYSLDCFVHVPPGFSKEQLLAAIHGHILEEASLTGLYSE